LEEKIGEGGRPLLDVRVRKERGEASKKANSYQGPDSPHLQHLRADGGGKR